MGPLRAQRLASFLASLLLRPRVAQAQEANRHPHSVPPQIPLHPLGGGWPRLLFAARIERYTCPLQACSFSLQGWGLIDLPLRASFSPSHPLARRDVPLARARGVRDRALHEHRRPSSLPSAHTPSALPRFSQEGGLFGLPLRASNEGLLRPRVARAKEANRPPSHSSFDRHTPSRL